jgi:hypothetical protein
VWLPAPLHVYAGPTSVREWYGQVPALLAVSRVTPVWTARLREPDLKANGSYLRS